MRARTAVHTNPRRAALLALGTPRSLPDSGPSIFVPCPSLLLPPFARSRCSAKIDSGVVEQPVGMITDECQAQGYALMCMAFPKSDCALHVIPEVGAVAGCFQAERSSGQSCEGVAKVAPFSVPGARGNAWAARHRSAAFTPALPVADPNLTCLPRCPLLPWLPSHRGS